MLSVIDAPEVVEYEEHDIYEERPQVLVARSGFWHTLVQYMRRHRVHRLHSTPSSSQVSVHPFEMPMERLAREYPTLYLRVFTGL
jgi:hypothetical protein